MLITAQRHWWKDILKLWRRCVVFSLSFDYIPNYSASKQLNQAWMLQTDSVCNWTMLLYFEHPTALISCQCVSEREGETFDERVVFVKRRSLPWLQGSIVSEWHHHASLEESMKSWFERRRECVCVCVLCERAHVENGERVSLRTVLFFTVTP